MATAGDEDVMAKRVSIVDPVGSTEAIAEMIVLQQQQQQRQQLQPEPASETFTTAPTILTTATTITTTVDQQSQQQCHNEPLQDQSQDRISEDLLVSKALIEIGANEACRDLLNAGDEFEDFSALTSAIAAVSKLTNAVFTIYDCQTIAKANRSRCVKVEPLDEKFKYKYVKYVCKQFGHSRRRTVPGIRPNQKTYKTGCSALIAASVDREKQRMVIRSINLNHSHQMLGHMYPENRRQSLNDNILSETYHLIDVGMNTKNIREYISNMTGKLLTTRDINNLRAKRKKQLGPSLLRHTTTTTTTTANNNNNNDTTSTTSSNNNNNNNVASNNYNDNNKNNNNSNIHNNNSNNNSIHNNNSNNSSNIPNNNSNNNSNSHNNISNHDNNNSNDNSNIIDCNIFSPKDDGSGHTKHKRGTQEMEFPSPISSHVFDISKGRPAIGVPVLLFIQFEKQSWKLLQKSASSVNGHLSFLSGEKMVKTTAYKLFFDTESYFKVSGQSAFYPYIELVFQVMDPTLRHHIAIQISPHSYSCHRELIQQNSGVSCSSPHLPAPSGAH
ncbi:hypothetical protein Ahia01_000453700 [Argonauta hians]